MSTASRIAASAEGALAAAHQASANTHDTAASVAAATLRAVAPFVPGAPSSTAVILQLANELERL